MHSFTQSWQIWFISHFHLKGLCHPRCMRKLTRSTLKSLAQLFQISSESSGGCYIALDVNVNVNRLVSKNCLYSIESDSDCKNQASLGRNTSLKKRLSGLYCACTPADIVPLRIRKSTRTRLIRIPSWGCGAILYCYWRQRPAISSLGHYSVYCYL